MNRTFYAFLILTTACAQNEPTDFEATAETPIFSAASSGESGESGESEESEEPGESSETAEAQLPGFDQTLSPAPGYPPLPPLSETAPELAERAIPMCTAAPAGSFNATVRINGATAGNVPWVFGTNFSGYTNYVDGLETFDSTNGIGTADLASLRSRLLRTPGGCISESYYWDKTDPQGTPAPMIRIEHASGPGVREIPTFAVSEWQTLVDRVAGAQSAGLSQLHTVNLSFDENLRNNYTPCSDRPADIMPFERGITNLVTHHRDDVSLWELGNEPWGSWTPEEYDSAARLAATEIQRLDPSAGIIGVGYPTTVHHAAGSDGALLRTAWNEKVRALYDQGQIDYVADHPYMTSGLSLTHRGELTRLRTAYLEEDHVRVGGRYCMLDANYGPRICDPWEQGTWSENPLAMTMTAFKRGISEPRRLLRVSVLPGGGNFTNVRYNTCNLTEGTPGTCDAPGLFVFNERVEHLEIAGFDDPLTGAPKLAMFRVVPSANNTRRIEGRTCAPSSNPNQPPFSTCNGPWSFVSDVPADSDSRNGYAAFIRELNEPAVHSEDPIITGKQKLIFVMLSSADRSLVRGCNLVNDSSNFGYRLDCGNWILQDPPQDSTYLPDTGRDRLLDLAGWVGHMPYDAYPEKPFWGAAAWMAADNVPRIIAKGAADYDIPASRLAYTEWNLACWSSGQVAGTMSQSMMVFETLMTLARQNVPIGVYHQLGRRGGGCDLFEPDGTNTALGLRFNGPGKAFSLAAAIGGTQARHIDLTVERRSNTENAPGCTRDNLSCFSGFSNLPILGVHAGRDQSSGDAVLLLANRDETRWGSVEIDLRALPGFENIPPEDLLIDQQTLWASSFSSRDAVEENASCRHGTGLTGRARIKVRPMSVTRVRIAIQRRWTIELSPRCTNGHNGPAETRDLGTILGPGDEPGLVHGHNPAARPIYISWLRWPEQTWRTTYSANGTVALPMSSTEAVNTMFVYVRDAAGDVRPFVPPPPSPAIQYITAFNPPTPVARWVSTALDDGTYALPYTGRADACP